MRQFVINLDPKFTPLGEGVNNNIFDFPSGCEPHIQLSDELVSPYSVSIACRIKNGNDVMRLLLCVDALKRKFITSYSLFISYLPFARQDRVMNHGEPLSLKVFSDLINSCGFNRVEIFDPHSDVALACINNSVAIPNYDFVKAVMAKLDTSLIVCPDAGAYKKIVSLCKNIGYKSHIVYCNKIRDVSTGKIVEITVDSDNFNGRDLVIVDDICDGGGTFILLAEKLKSRNAGKISLIVSHGIFSQGQSSLMRELSHIYTTDSFQDFGNSKFLTQYKLQDIV